MISNHLNLVEQQRQQADSILEHAARILEAVGAWRQVKVEPCAA
ncbi:UNVERIFIED_ORG: hypothetical protein J2Y94_003108 [Pseudomonas poae]